MSNFSQRIIELTSEKITITAKCNELYNTLHEMNYSERTKVKLENRLSRKREELEHCENNLKINIMMNERKLMKYHWKMKYQRIRNNLLESLEK